MKELSIEQKAKRYDEVLAWMRNLYQTMEGAMKEDMEHYFPELKESDDEKIRKWLITFFKNEYGTNSNARFAGSKVKDIIAWLERQSEKDVVLRDAFGYEEGRQRGLEEGVMLVLDNPLKYGLEKQGEQNAIEPDDLIEESYQQQEDEL